MSLCRVYMFVSRTVSHLGVGSTSSFEQGCSCSYHPHIFWVKSQHYLHFIHEISTKNIFPSWLRRLHVRLSKLLVHEKDISIIWKGPIANHSFIAILPSLRNIDLQGVSLRLNAAEVDMILYS